MIWALNIGKVICLTKIRLCGLHIIPQLDQEWGWHTSRCLTLESDGSSNFQCCVLIQNFKESLVAVLLKNHNERTTSPSYFKILKEPTVFMKELVVLWQVFDSFNFLKTMVICQNEVFDFVRIMAMNPKNHPCDHCRSVLFLIPPNTGSFPVCWSTSSFIFANLLKHMITVDHLFPQQKSFNFLETKACLHLVGKGSQKSTTCRKDEVHLWAGCCW